MIALRKRTGTSPVPAKRTKMKELPNLPTTLVVADSYTRGKWFIRESLHVIEQRDSNNFIACYPNALEKQIHFRIITSPNQLYQLNFHDYVLVGRIDDYMLTCLETYATRMKTKFNLGLVE